MFKTVNPWRPLLLHIQLLAYRRFFFIVVGVFVLSLFVQSAQADSIARFSCGVVCGGGPVTSGSTFSATGANSITNLLTNVPGVTGPFTFSFDTGVGTANLFDLSDTLSGTIFGPVSVTPGGTTTGISFGVLWDLTPAPNVSGFLSGIPNLGAGVSQVSFETIGGVLDSASVTISPTPEPGTLALFGSGILLCGRLLRRKKQTRGGT